MSLLDMAVVYWRLGIPAPLDITTRLLEEGYDIEALENEYMSNTIH